MRAPFLITVVMVLSVGSAPALAFQEMPEPPPADIPGAVAQPDALHLGTPGGGVAVPDEGGINVFGYTLLPKLDLGLDVMYGQDQQPSDLQGPTMLEENGDVTVLGRVKRRF
jgi:hypothetical protein